MGLYIITGPTWEEDSHASIHDEAVEMNIAQKSLEGNEELDTLDPENWLSGSQEDIMLTNPVVSVMGGSDD